jgi:hypothetical protein
MVRPRGYVALDWKRWSRGCVLGTVVMLVWLLAPVISCTFGVFRDTPIGDVNPDTAQPAGADRDRVDAGEGFVGKLVHGAKVCYARTPLLGQEPWKTKLLAGFAGAAVLLWLIGVGGSRRPRTIG